MNGTHGTLEKVGDDWQLRFVRRFAKSAARVWRAVGDPDGMRAWFPARMEGERRAGSPLTFVFAEAPEHDSHGEMIAYEPPHLLEMTWEDDRLRAELHDVEDGGCELRFSATFRELGKAARDAAGWHVCLDDLERHVAGHATDEADDAAWQPLMKEYSAKFPPEASTIGPPDWHPEGQ